jgi:hypothetical protein
MKRTFFWVKYKIRYSIPEKVWNFFSSKISPIRFNHYLEKRKSFGEANPEIIFYVIRRRPPGWGYFSNLFHVAQGLLYAEEKGYVPIVDMENYWMAELNSLKKINGTYNSWCYFFQQVSNYTLEEVYSSKNVILSNGSTILGRDHWLTMRKNQFILDREKLARIKKLFSSHLFINAPTLKFIENEKKIRKWEPSSTLGIFIRGTNYYENLPFLAESIPSLDFFINETKSILFENKNIDKIFICTEDYRVYLRLKKEFEDYIDIPSVRFKTDLNLDEWIKSQEQLTHDGGILMGFDRTLEYLTEVLLLGECKYFIGTPSNASAFALTMSDLYSGVHRVILSNKVFSFN